MVLLVVVFAAEAAAVVVLGMVRISATRRVCRALSDASRGGPVGGAVCWVVRARGVRVRPGVQAGVEGKAGGALLLSHRVRRDSVKLRFKRFCRRNSVADSRPGLPAASKGAWCAA